MSFSLSDAFGLRGATGGADDQDPPKDSREPEADGEAAQDFRHQRSLYLLLLGIRRVFCTLTSSSAIRYERSR